MTPDPRGVEVFFDRVEGEFVVLVWEGKGFSVPKSWLPPEAKEGEVLRLTLGRDPEATEAARARVEAKRHQQGSGDDGGDFSL